MNEYVNGIEMIAMGIIYSYVYDLFLYIRHACKSNYANIYIKFPFML